MKEPVRTCVGCGSRRPKSELTRLWVDREGNVSITIDKRKKKYPGRGVYICVNGGCIDNVRKNGRISRQLGRDIQPEIYKELLNIASGGE